MDVLSDAIAAMRLGKPHSSRTSKRGDWGIRFPSADGAGFHVVLKGRSWLLPSGGTEPTPLGVGDAVFLSHGTGHALAHSPDSPLTDVLPNPDGTWPVLPDPPGGEPPTAVILCGAYRLDRSRAHPLLTELPEVVHFPAGLGRHTALRSGIQLLGEELEQRGAGTDAAVPALLDLLLVYMLRAWFADHACDGSRGWAAALGDPYVTAALSAMHADPARPWTVEELGEVAGLSRAAFAKRFTALVGQPPLAYLTWWRMTTAGRLLRTGDLPVRLVAERSGYTSEFAFAKAFKRQYGAAPGQYRRARGGPGADNGSPVKAGR